MDGWVVGGQSSGELHFLTTLGLSGEDTGGRAQASFACCVFLTGQGWHQSMAWGLGIRLLNNKLMKSSG